MAPNETITCASQGDDGKEETDWKKALILFVNGKQSTNFQIS